MAVDTNLNFQSLFESLKVEDPWLPPRTWESIPSQSQQTHLPSRRSAGISSSSVSVSFLVHFLYLHPSFFRITTCSTFSLLSIILVAILSFGIVILLVYLLNYNSSIKLLRHRFLKIETTIIMFQESSLVRLAMNALQGLESALISVENLSAAFCSDASDRTFHQIPSLWNRFSSTHVLGKILRSIGCVGFLVFLLHKFVDHFTELGIDQTFNQTSNQPKLEECKSNDDSNVIEKQCSQKSLVNQAFAVALRKILEGYMCALDSLHASVGLRRTSKVPDAPFLESSVEGCLMSVVHSEITLLEMYLHTRELRIQIEVLGNICNLHDIANCFSLLPFHDLIDKATSEFCSFHRGGDLLTYLYTQLQVS